MIPINHCRYAIWRHGVLGIVGAAGVLAIGGIQPLSIGIAVCLAAAAVASTLVLLQHLRAVSQASQRWPAASNEVDGLAQWRARATPDWSAQIEIARVHLESQITMLATDFAKLASARLLEAGVRGPVASSVRDAMKLRNEMVLKLSDFIEELRKISRVAGAAIKAERADSNWLEREVRRQSTESSDITVF